MKNFYEMLVLLEYNYVIDLVSKVQDSLFSMYLDIAKIYHQHYHHNVLSAEDRQSLEDSEDVNSHIDYNLSGGLPHDYVQKELLGKFGAEKLSSAARAKTLPPGRFGRAPWGANPVDLEAVIPLIMERIKKYLKDIRDELFMLKHAETDFSSNSLELLSDPNNILGLLQQQKFDEVLDSIKEAEQDLIKYVSSKGGRLYAKIDHQVESDPTRWRSNRY